MAVIAYEQNPFDSSQWTAREHNAIFPPIDGVDVHSGLAAHRIAAYLTKMGDTATADEVISLPSAEFERLRRWYNEIFS